ncbi:MAG: DUF2029 domain-containing protein [Candidatus Heimdallarchaeota archaeon]|nr:DUF2029 domain-containing protein [Candidatus Heimdallarchaeota archaeon]
MERISQLELLAELKYRLALHLCVALIQLTFAFLYVNPVDVMVQYYAAIDISQGLLLYQDVQNHSGLPYPTYPPVYLYYLAALFLLFGASLSLLKLQLIVFNTLLAEIIYTLARELWIEPQVASKVLILNYLNPVQYILVYAGFYDNVVISLYFLSILLLFKRRFILSGFFLAVSIMAKQFSLILVPLFILYLMRTKGVKQAVQFISSLGLSVFLIALPFMGTDRFIHDLIYHLEDVRPNISMYYYFLDSLDSFSVHIQFSVMCLYFFYLLLSEYKSNHQFLYSLYMLNIIFFFFNRIMYPHYIPYFTVFLPFVICYVRPKFKYLNILGSISYMLMFAGILLYSITWVRYPSGDRLFPVEYQVSSWLYCIGMLGILITSGLYQRNINEILLKNSNLIVSNQLYPEQNREHSQRDP